MEKYYEPEIDFCSHCPYYGEPNGCNRPDGECDSYDRFLEIYYKLDEYKVADASGLLKKLPCKIYDDIWFVWNQEGTTILEKGKVNSISLQPEGIWLYARYESGLTYWHKEKDVGKVIFFNKEDAEIKCNQK